VLSLEDEAHHMLSVIMLRVILLSVAAPLIAEEYHNAGCHYADLCVVLGR
jgi:hypothetical protein